MNRIVRTRFAPSPTGGLHLGGVRTALFNYLFARSKGGKFVLRIEDTDQTRLVPGAESYILQCLEWCGIIPDESPAVGGPFAPYRQSERKTIYTQYAEQLVADGRAYYAFDTPEELNAMRASQANQQYDHTIRMKMRNSLALPEAEVNQLIQEGVPYVIRIKMEPGQTVSFTDLIRGHISYDTSVVDDKVLLKADGMPTYHLAVVVDDYLMEITHAFRGEEWLPSAPVHLLLWEYLGWKDKMPKWVHLPLILKPDGNGKLSKRDGERLGFPVFPLSWTDATGATMEGFKEKGFLPEAFVNMLAMLGWHDENNREFFTLEELAEVFTLERVSKGGAKFDYEKAKWFNHQYLMKTPDNELIPLVKPYIEKQTGAVDEEILSRVVPLIKERCSLMSDFWDQSYFFFRDPESVDEAALMEKWNDSINQFFNDWINAIAQITEFNATSAEQSFNDILQTSGLKKGSVMLPLRIMLVGGKFGPGVFDIAGIIGKDAVIRRIQKFCKRG